MKQIISDSEFSKFLSLDLNEKASFATSFIDKLLPVSKITGGVHFCDIALFHPSFVPSFDTISNLGKYEYGTINGKYVIFKDVNKLGYLFFIVEVK